MSTAAIVGLIASIIAIAVGGYGLHKVKQAAEQQPSGMMGLALPLALWAGVALAGVIGALVAAGVLLA